MSEDETAIQPGRGWLSYVRPAFLVLVSFAGGLALLYGVLQQAPAGAARWIDVLFGALASAALVFSRRAPVPVALALAGVAAVFASGGLANMLALYAVARHRQLTVALLIASFNVVCGCFFWTLYPKNSSLLLTFTVNVAIAAALTAWGALRQAQKALLDSYRERAERLEREQELREREIRRAERTRIAREMHDAVAHRISLVALHAGGLDVMPDPAQSDVRRSAELIRSAAVQALEELRVAIGVLRADEPRSLEQPGLDRVDDLLRDATDAGQRVAVARTPDIADGVPPDVGRAAYRIVQEGLTNARKHAPGSAVSLTLRRTSGGLLLQIRNPLTAERLEMPGSDRGLIGLTERVALTGGTLHYGISESHQFELCAELTWK
ncbi:histidine kinase [Micromonospora sp. MH33]|uniref:sensor histidine kinase n=1 Tax=Micromonospora sp. MH33 TaxID=1945509 RepID=UPI0011B285CA|nr:histidine kinase [Micromonospora sp. MH33]